jgi:hypothetical protein
MLHVYCLLEHFDKIEINLAYGFRLDLDLAYINLGYNSIWAECRLWGAKVTGYVTFAPIGGANVTLCYPPKEFTF